MSTNDVFPIFLHGDSDAEICGRLPDCLSKTTNWFSRLTGRMIGEIVIADLLIPTIDACFSGFLKIVLGHEFQFIIGVEQDDVFPTDSK